jgi:hypothetical protein
VLLLMVFFKIPVTTFLIESGEPVPSGGVMSGGCPPNHLRPNRCRSCVFMVGVVFVQIGAASCGCGVGLDAVLEVWFPTTKVEEVVVMWL